MAMNMDALLRIKADVQGENNIRRLGNSMQGLQGQAKNAAMGFNNLKGAVAGFGAAIAGSAIVGGLTAVIKKSIDAGDELFNLQAKTGIAANTLIGIGNAAELADVDLATLGKGAGADAGEAGLEVRALHQRAVSEPEIEIAGVEHETCGLC